MNTTNATLATASNANRKLFKDVSYGDYIYCMTKNKAGVYELRKVKVLAVRTTSNEQGTITDLVTENAILLCLCTDELRNGSVYGRNGASTYFSDEQEAVTVTHNNNVQLIEDLRNNLCAISENYNMYFLV